MKKIYMLEELLHEIVPMLYNFRKECRTCFYGIKFMRRKNENFRDDPFRNCIACSRFLPFGVGYSMGINVEGGR